MKKLIITAALILTAGIVMSFTRVNTVKQSPVLAQNTDLTFKKDLGSGD